MSYSSGTRSMLGEVVGWTVTIAVLALVIVNYADVRRGVAHVLGIPDPATVEAQQRTAAQQEVAQEPPRSGYAVELTAADNGHFHTEAEINGRAIEVMVDTGATMVALTYEDAERAGIYLKDSDYTHTVSTANGNARIALVNLDRVSIGDITVRGVQAAVSEPGKLSVTLLGMTFLSRLDRVDMRSGRLLLQD